MNYIISTINFVLNILFKIVIIVGVFTWLSKGTDLYNIGYTVEIVVVVSMTVLTILKGIVKDKLYKDWTVCN